MSIHCPICGSDKISVISQERVGELTLGQPFSYKAQLHQCEDCKEEGNFDGQLDDGYEAALESAERELAVCLIEQLESNGNSLQHLERSFELPFRTLSRWKKGNCSASGLALLRIATALPFVTNIAEQRYSPRSILEECGGFFVKAVSSHLGSEFIRDVEESASAESPNTIHSFGVVQIIGQSEEPQIRTVSGAKPSTLRPVRCGT